jgi:hypothetical protein
MHLFRESFSEGEQRQGATNCVKQNAWPLADGGK